MKFLKAFALVPATMPLTMCIAAAPPPIARRSLASSYHVGVITRGDSVDQNIPVTPENSSVTNTEGKLATSLERLSHVATMRMPKISVLVRRGKGKKGTGKGKGKAMLVLAVWLVS